MSAISSRHKDKLGEAVNFFSKFINCKPKLSNTVEVQLHLATIEEKSVSCGLEADYLPTLVDVAACGHLAQKWSLRLVKALIPKTTVPESAVMKAVSWMCTNKPPIAVQVGFILLMFLNHLQTIYHLFTSRLCG
ncbi:centromere protein I-like [Gigantopelta aegis]|uniref:centromere protein I-like n=1 Tax=Gigantopelta aegis TaxID=1735272 RepID=UPI001B88784E|nr:centromere protein I-like [Gigantopelta aegis]